MDKCFESFASEGFRRSFGDFMQIVRAYSSNPEQNQESNRSTCVSQSFSEHKQCPYNPLSLPQSTSGGVTQQIACSHLQNHANSNQKNETSPATKLTTAALLCHNAGHDKGAALNHKTDMVITNPSCITQLFGWCPINIEVDGGCSIAGLYRIKQPTLSCAFTITSRVSSVLDGGQCVTTEDHQKYHLNGGICWPVYNAVTLNIVIDTLPGDIADAFSAGFPAKKWRAWTQRLLDHIDVSSGGSNNHIPVGIGYTNKRRSLNTDLDDSYLCESGEVYADQTESETISTCSEDLSRAAVHGSKIQSDYRGIGKQHYRHRSRASRSPVPRNSELPSRCCATKSPSDRFRNHRRTREDIESNCHQRHSGAIRHNQRGPKRSSEDSANVPGADERYKLYTASGTVIDSRNLRATPSGRPVIPQLDSRFDHRLQMDGNRVVDVSHDCDDTASWILRKRRQ